MEASFPARTGLDCPGAARLVVGKNFGKALFTASAFRRWEFSVGDELEGKTLE
jgi:hypothetical protein